LHEYGPGYASAYVENTKTPAGRGWLRSTAGWLQFDFLE
jgi:hypothetical protein